MDLDCCCCSCHKQRECCADTHFNHGFCHKSRLKVQASVCFQSRFWLDPVDFEAFINIFQQILVPVFSVRIFYLFLLLFHFPTTTFASQQSFIFESSVNDFHQCSNSAVDEVPGCFCNQLKSQEVKSYSKFQVEKLFCDHIPMVALLNLDSQVFTDLTNCRTTLKNILNADALAKCQFYDFQKIMHHYSTHEGYSVHSDTTMCLVSYFCLPININIVVKLSHDRKVDFQINNIKQ